MRLWTMMMHISEIVAAMAFARDSGLSRQSGDDGWGDADFGYHSATSSQIALGPRLLDTCRCKGAWLGCYRVRSLGAVAAISLLLAFSCRHFQDNTVTSHIRKHLEDISCTRDAEVHDEKIWQSSPKSMVGSLYLWKSYIPLMLYDKESFLK